MIEVEKKFILDDQARKRLVDDAEFVGERIFTDAYYDTKDFFLTRKDRWLRFRDGRLELKLPMHEGPERLADQYEELEDEETIRASLGLPDGDISRVLIEAGYEPFCVCKTTRKKYKKGPFMIDLDEVDFQDSDYRLGEIECMVNDTSEVEDAIKRIIDFAKEKGLTIAPVRGKVIECIKRKRPDQYRVLIEAGVIKNV
ncbi:MAG: CYTH domain-containing protein [Candidatus Uhrbacteria bacterium]|nr:CYTH domain-containing protein [Candidatus Uhrbacteria bacterium]